MSSTNAEVRGSINVSVKDNASGPVSKMIKTVQSLGNESRATSSKVDSMTGATRKASESARRLGEAARRGSEHSNKAASSMTKLANSSRTAGSGLDTAKRSADQASNSMRTLTKESNSAGNAIGKAGNTAGGAGANGIKSVEQASTSAGQGVIGLATSMQGLTASITGVSDTLFGFQEKVIALEKSKFGLKETTEDLKRAEEDYRQDLEDGEKSVLEMQRTLKDLTLLREKHRIETEEVRAEEEALNSEYVSFAANLAGVGIQAATTAQSLRLLSGSNLATGATARTAAGGLTAMSVAMKAMPILAIASALSALYLAWENNWGGMRDGVHALIDGFQSFYDTVKQVILPLQYVEEALESLGVDIGGSVDRWQEFEKAERDLDSMMKAGLITIEQKQKFLSELEFREEAAAKGAETHAEAIKLEAEKAAEANERINALKESKGLLTDISLTTSEASMNATEVMIKETEAAHELSGGYDKLADSQERAAASKERLDAVYQLNPSLAQDAGVVTPPRRRGGSPDIQIASEHGALAGYGYSGEDVARITESIRERWQAPVGRNMPSIIPSSNNANVNAVISDFANAIKEGTRKIISNSSSVPVGANSGVVHASGRAIMEQNIR